MIDVVRYYAGLAAPFATVVTLGCVGYMATLVISIWFEHRLPRTHIAFQLHTVGFIIIASLGFAVRIWLPEWRDAYSIIISIAAVRMALTTHDYRLYIRRVLTEHDRNSE